MDKFKIAVIIGSLRKESYNRKMANAVLNTAPTTLELEIVEIGDLNLYNEDLESDVPKAWLDFREKIKPFDAVLFVTPEYNRSVPAVLKNALDVGSRPYSQSVWNGKPSAVISVTPGNLGAFGSNHHLRQSLVSLNMPTMQQPEAYISGASKLFDNEGGFINDSTAEFIKKFLFAFYKWVSSNSLK